MRWPRSDFALCSPRAQRTASAMLLLPHPLGPTMPVMPGRTLTVVRLGEGLEAVQGDLLEPHEVCSTAPCVKP